MIIRFQMRLMVHFVYVLVKTEVKLEERINGMEIKEENTEFPSCRLKYPNNMREFFERNSPQLFLMQVIYKTSTNSREISRIILI